MYIMNRKLHSTAVRVLATLAVTVASSGCAMKGDIRLLQEELRTIAARQDSLVTDLRNEARQTQDTLRTQGDQMFDLRGDVNRQLQQIAQSLVRLEAIAGENQRGMASIRDQLANVRRMPSTGGTTTGSDPGGGDESLVSGGGNASQLYQVAQDQLNRGSLNSASRAFEQFITEHPNDPRVADAHFFLGHVRTEQDRPEDALEAFGEVQRLFPTHARVPDALFRIAILQIELDDVEAAKGTLERIINTYPDELVAMLAREKLSELG